MSTIKVSIINSSLHESLSFDEHNKDFISKIENELGSKIIVSKLDDYNCDLKLIFVASGGSESVFLSNIQKIKEPYYLLTSGDNNSLAASLEILTYLNNKNLNGEVIHGSINYIVSRINNLLNKQDDCNCRLGVVGKPSDWLISSIPDYEAIKRMFGIELVDINLQEIVDKFENLEMPSVYTDNDGFSGFELNMAEKVYQILDDIAINNRLDGLTIRCFDLLSKIKTTGCLALAKLNDRNIVSACEGDIMALISMYLVSKLFDLPSFQANPSRIDTDNNLITFAHCTIPTKMTNKYRYDTHFESGIGVAIKGELKTDDVTIFRLSSDLKSFFLEEGKIISNLNEPNLCRTQIVVKMNNLGSILTHPCGNHHIIFYGKHKDELMAYLKQIF